MSQGIKLLGSWLACALVLMSLGCTRYSPMQIAASTEPIGKRSYDIVGKARGESCQFTIFNFAVSEGGRTYDAFQAALQSSGAEALIDVTADYRQTVYPLNVQRDCAVVEGQAIKFK